MKYDLDQLTEALTKSANLSKVAQSPKVYAKLRQWLMKLKGKNQAAKMIARKAEDLMHYRSLKKNEVMTSFYKSGVMKMDFGSEVPETIKKAALKWARKRGLQVVEASLAKSVNSPSTYVLNITEDIVPYGDCVKRSKWSV